MKLKDSIILILVVVVATGVGALVGYKISNNFNNKENIENIETDYDLKKARELMDKYKIIHLYGKPRYIESINEERDETLKNILAIQNTEISQNYSCKSVFGKTEFLVGDIGICYDFESSPGEESHKKSLFYKYSDVLTSKQNLFGKKTSLNKENIEWGSQVFDYHSEHDVFVELIYFGGGDDPTSIEYNIKSAKISNGILTIVVEKKVINYNDDTSTIEYREYLFEKEEQHYYLFDIKKI